MNYAKPLGFLDLTQPPPQPKRLFYFAHVDGKDWVTVQWGGYDYDIEMSRIDTPLSLLHWVTHLAEKEWEDTTPERIGLFVEKVCQKKGWDLWRA